MSLTLESKILPNERNPESARVSLARNRDERLRSGEVPSCPGKLTQISVFSNRAALSELCALRLVRALVMLG